MNSRLFSATAMIRSKLFTKLADDDGAGLAEYALLLLLIALVCVTALTTLGGTISGVYNTANGMFN